MTGDVELALAQLSEAEVAEMKRLGIVRQPIDSYRVGTFRYSNLGDAIGQAKRQHSIGLEERPGSKGV